jgi:hypothetical protein
MTDYVKLHDNGYPLERQLGGYDGEEKTSQCIAAPAGLPGFKEATSANPPISAYAKKFYTFKLQTGGGGTIGGQRLNANVKDNLDGDGN